MALPITHLIDELATAYVQAIAAAAGAVIAVNRDYGVDGILKHIEKIEEDGYVETGYPVDFQLKGTTRVAKGRNAIRFDLRARNYNLIATRPQTATPYYLFLVCFDTQAENWMTLDAERLIMNATAFWWTHSGVRTTNTASVRIDVPSANRLTPEAIAEMLRASQERYV